MLYLNHTQTEVVDVSNPPIPTNPISGWVMFNNDAYTPYHFKLAPFYKHPSGSITIHYIRFGFPDTETYHGEFPSHVKQVFNISTGKLPNIPS